MEVRFKRGTTAQNDAYTGAAGSISLDTELNQIRVHDGLTAGGHIIPNDTSLADLQTQLDSLGITDISGLETALAGKIATSEINAANGVAGLDANGKVAAAQLPSFVDDVLEFADQASFPASGESGKIYVALDTNQVYRWSGTVYVEIAASPGSTDSVAEGTTNLYFTEQRARDSIGVAGDLSYDSATGIITFTESVTSVAGKTGAVTLVKGDVGLGNVENYGVATQAEAEAATVSNKYMTPQAARQFVEFMGFTEESPGNWVLDEGSIA